MNPGVVRIVTLGFAAFLASLAACEGFTGAEAPAVDAGVDGQPAVILEAGPAPDAAAVVDGRAADATPAERAATYGAAVLADSPLAYWRFHDQPGVGNASDSADASAADAAGATIPPLVIATSPGIGTPGLFAPAGGAFTFDGTGGQRLEAANLTYLGDRAFTFEAWYRPTAVVDTTLRYLAWHSKEGDDHAYGIFFHTTRGIAVETLDGDANRWIRTDAPSVGEWHHVVFVSPLVLYLDGVSFTIPNQNVNGTPAAGATPFRIGAKTDSAKAIQGSLTEVAIYAHALTPDRILLHRELGRPQ